MYLWIKWPTRNRNSLRRTQLAAGQRQLARMASTGFDLSPYANYILEYKLAAE